MFIKRTQEITQLYALFSLVRASLSQKWIVPSDPKRAVSISRDKELRARKFYHKWRKCHGLDGMICHSQRRPMIDPSKWDFDLGGGTWKKSCFCASSSVLHPLHSIWIETYEESFSSIYLQIYFSTIQSKSKKQATHWMATLPSMLPMAKPLFWEEVKQETTRVCHFSGETMV